MTTTNTSPGIFTGPYTPLETVTKRKIVDRLIEAGYITLDEALTLLEKETVYIPQQVIPPYIPYTPPAPWPVIWSDNPYTITMTNNSTDGK